MTSQLRILALLVGGLLFVNAAQAQTVTVRLPVARADRGLDGRLLFLVSNDPKAMSDPKAEPRKQINDTLKTQMVFGVTVDGWKPGESVVIGKDAKGYPRGPDTAYIRHIRIQSTLLTKFRGRPMYMSAIALIPEGYYRGVESC